MRRLLGRTGWSSLATFFSAALMATGLSLTGAPAQAAFELPEGEKITNLPAIPRAIPQKEAYELYDPKIGKNFDLKNSKCHPQISQMTPIRFRTAGFVSPFGKKSVQSA